MNKEKNYSILIFVLLLLAVVVASCGTSEDAVLIGSYPALHSGEMEFDHLPNNSIIIYHSQIDLQVQSIPSSVDDIIELAGKYGGYTTYAYIWYQDTDEHATVIVSVPTFNFDSLYDRITRLGKLLDETIIGELSSSSNRDNSKLEMSTITVHLTKKSTFTSPSVGEWRPLSTFADAFEVASAIFRFLFDVIIWIAVIAGPFVLIWWLFRQAAKRWKITIKKTNQEK